MTIGPKEERLCPVQPANADESASSTTGTSQESGQNEPSGHKPLLVLKLHGGLMGTGLEMLKEQAKTLACSIGAIAVVTDDGLDIALHQPIGMLADRLDQLIALQAQGNALLLALIESMAEGGDSEEFHMPKPL